MQFSIGDTVVFLNEKGEGVITGVKSKLIALVTTTDGFEIPYPFQQLVVTKKAPIPQPVIQEIEKMEFKITNEQLSGMFSRSNVKSVQPKLSKKHAHRSGVLEKEVDLHIEELVDYPKHLSNAEIVSIQLGKFRRELDDAISNHLHKIVFIHGVGAGVLKSEIRALLAEYDHIEFFDAPFSKYGYGATEVRIKNH